MRLSARRLALAKPKEADQIWDKLAQHNTLTETMWDSLEASRAGLAPFAIDCPSSERSSDLPPTSARTPKSATVSPSKKTPKPRGVRRLSMIAHRAVKRRGSVLGISDDKLQASWRSFCPNRRAAIRVTRATWASFVLLILYAATWAVLRFNIENSERFPMNLLFCRVCRGVAARPLHPTLAPHPLTPPSHAPSSDRLAPRSRSPLRVPGTRADCASPVVLHAPCYARRIERRWVRQMGNNPGVIAALTVFGALTIPCLFFIGASAYKNINGGAIFYLFLYSNVWW